MEMIWAETTLGKEVRVWYEMLAKWEEKQVCHTCSKCLVLSPCNVFNIIFTAQHRCHWLPVKVLERTLKYFCVLNVFWLEVGVLGMFEPVHLTAQLASKLLLVECWECSGHWSIELLLLFLKNIWGVVWKVWQSRRASSKPVCFVVHEPTIPQGAILLPSSC